MNDYLDFYKGFYIGVIDAELDFESEMVPNNDSQWAKGYRDGQRRVKKIQDASLHT